MRLGFGYFSVGDYLVVTPPHISFFFLFSGVLVYAGKNTCKPETSSSESFYLYTSQAEIIGSTTSVLEICVYGIIQ